jgi:hypothetical protein
MSSAFSYLEKEDINHVFFCCEFLKEKKYGWIFLNGYMLILFLLTIVGVIGEKQIKEQILSFNLDGHYLLYLVGEKYNIMFRGEIVNL